MVKLNNNQKDILRPLMLINSIHMYKNNSNLGKRSSQMVTLEPTEVRKISLRRIKSSTGPVPTIRETILIRKRTRGKATRSPNGQMFYLGTDDYHKKHKIKWN